MSILKVARMGHPVLRERARRVEPSEITTPEFQKLIDDMFETVDAYDGIGLAAPQVHEGVRLVLVGIDQRRQREDDEEEGAQGRREGTEEHGGAEEGDRERGGEEGSRGVEEEEAEEEDSLSVYALINPEIRVIGRETGEDWE